MSNSPQPPPDQDTPSSEAIPEAGPVADDGREGAPGHTGEGAESVVAHLHHNLPAPPER